MPAPEAEGSLAETPFAHLLLYLYRQAGSGTLRVLAEDGGETWVRFRQGRPVAARTDGVPRSLEDALLPACALTQGSFQFFSADLMNDGSPVTTGMVDPYALLYASMAGYSRDDMVHAVLARYPSMQLFLPPERDLGRLKLKREDQELVSQLRKAPRSIEELVASTSRPEIETKRLLYTLVVTHMVAPQEDRSTDTYRSQVSEEPVAARAETATPASTDGVVADAAEQATTIEIPNVTASGRDRTRAQGSVNEIASASMPAWQRLMSMRPGASGSKSKPPANAPPSLKPPSPLRKSAAGAGEGKGIGAAMNDPAVRRKRAEQFMQAGRFTEALGLLDDLATELSKDAQIHGMRARALYEVHRAAPDGLPRTVLDAVRRAHEIDADEPNAYFTKGLVYKQGGELGKAAACWKRVLAADPKHIDAQRELRLAKLRGY